MLEIVSLNIYIYIYIPGNDFLSTEKSIEAKHWIFKCNQW